MVSNKQTLEIIKAIINRRYKSLMLSILGKRSLTRAEINELRANGIVVPEQPSLLELSYYHSLLNPHGVMGPKSLEDMKNQQSNDSSKPKGKAHEYAEQHANEAMKMAIDKLRQDTTNRIISLVQENNQNFKFSAIDSTEEVQKLVKESTLSKLKQRLRDTSGDANRDWSRVATTEISNAIGIGSVDRIVSQNKEKSLDEVYVYRIPVNDAALCSKCREFYLDSDGSPKVYKLSTLLGNGSNYGKPRSAWKPCIGATHPNDRESGAIELKRGWKVLPEGRQTYIGSEGWDDYIVNKLSK